MMLYSLPKDTLLLDAEVRDRFLTTFIDDLAEVSVAWEVELNEARGVSKAFMEL